MGSKNFWSIYNDVCKKYSLDKLKDKSLIIDIMLYITKYVIKSRSMGDDKTHIDALISIITSYLSNNIIPICMFDGWFSEVKQNNINERRQQVESASKRAKKLADDGLTDTIEFKKEYKKSFILTSEMIDECKMFLKLSGLPYFVAETEADKDCVTIMKEYNIFSGCVSEDSDIVISGGDIIKIDFKTKTYIELKYDDAFNHFQLLVLEICKNINIDNIDNIVVKYINFVNFTIILGNSYCDGIRFKLDHSINLDHCINLDEYEMKKFNILLLLFVEAKLNVYIMIKNLNKYNQDNINFSFYIPSNFQANFKKSQDFYLKKTNVDKIQYEFSECNNILLKKFFQENTFIDNKTVNTFMTFLKNYNILIKSFTKKFLFI